MAGPALLTAGIRGTGVLTEDLGDEVDRFEHAIGLGAEVQAGSVRPGAFVEVPLNGDTGDLSDLVYGFGLSYRLN